MRGRTSCISPARLGSGCTRVTCLSNPIGRRSSNVPAPGRLPVGPIPSKRKSLAAEYRRDETPPTTASSSLRRGPDYSVCSCCYRPPNATRRHPHAMPTRGGILSRRRKGDRIARTVGRMRLCGRSRGCFRASWLHISHFLVCRSVGRLLHRPALSARLCTFVPHPRR
jgi:hypothetical protein